MNMMLSAGILGLGSMAGKNGEQVQVLCIGIAMLVVVR
jgi:hypothetical protein